MKNARTVRINKLFLLVQVFLFAAIILKLSYVALSDSVDGVNIKEFASNRNTVTETLVADRGTIFDESGSALAQNVNSYTVIAYLSESRTTDPDNPHHVVDKEATAKALSPLINMSEERILYLLNYDAYQVELGPGGRGITELLKEEIEALELPGISFIKSVKRYYPKGDFLSYTLGYAKTDEENNIIGELGLELYYNDILTGVNGSKTYQQDLYGYQIANTPSYTEEAVSGSDIYLTIDTNIQLFAEQAISTLEEASLSWATVSVANAKTGEILAVASNPSFNPNTKDMESYYDPFVSYVYEPGSTMKIFSFMAAMEEGTYNGASKYLSGEILVGKDKVQDWNKKGWGEITFDQGFYASSNVAATMLAQSIGKDKLKNYYKLAGFGSKTGINLPNELSGVVNFKYDIEYANASFGQGMTVTAIQMVQALTSIANDGVMLKPYVVSKILDSKGNVTLQNKREEVAKIASSETVNKIKDLMRGVVSGEDQLATGSGYEVEGLNIIGKTGTAQIADSVGGGYLTGTNDYIKSFAGLFPHEDPEIIIYLAVSKGTDGNLLKVALKDLAEDIATYLGIEGINLESGSSYTQESFINKKTEDVKAKLEEKKLKPIIIGNGDKIIDQYPKKGEILNENDKVFLVTNDKIYHYPNMNGWSRSDVVNFGTLFDLYVKFDGYGYVINSSVNDKTEIKKGETLAIDLKAKYTLLEEDKNDKE